MLKEKNRMADKNIKLVNPQKFDVGVKTFDKPNGVNIQHGSFIPVSQDEVNYISTISDLIQRGVLRIENIFGQKEDVATQVFNRLGLDANDPTFSTDDDIRKHLAMSAKKIQEWLDQINEKFMLDRIYDIAMEMSDKMTAPKLKVLSTKMPDRDFIG